MTLIDFIIALFGAFFGVFSGAVMLNDPKKLLLPASLIGAVCWGVFIGVAAHWSGCRYLYIQCGSGLG